jgi:hypothetical protein
MRCCWAHGARDYDKAQEPHSRAEATRSPLGVKQMPNRFNDRGVRSEVSVSVQVWTSLRNENTTTIDKLMAVAGRLERLVGVGPKAAQYHSGSNRPCLRARRVTIKLELEPLFVCFGKGRFMEQIGWNTSGLRKADLTVYNRGREAVWRTWPTPRAWRRPESRPCA